jgi:glutaredoxin 3
MNAAVKMYTSGWCPYCMRAKALLERKAINYVEVSVEDAETRAEMIELTGGRRTVPQIFFGSRHIGGFDELYALDRAGALDKLLNEEKQ